MSQVLLPEPDRAIVSRRDAIVGDLRRLMGPHATIIGDEEGRRAFETDALTAYRRMPLAVALPTSTEEVSRLLGYCHQHGIKVVPRGAGTSLSGGALPAEGKLEGQLSVSSLRSRARAAWALRTPRRRTAARCP